MTRRLAVRVAGATLAVLLAMAGAVWAFASTLVPPQREILAGALEDQATLLVGLALLLSAMVAAGLAALLAPYAASARRLATATEVVATVNPNHRVPVEGAPEIRAIAAAVERLADGHRRLLRDVDETVQRASADVAQERNRLAALMAELSQPVVVCNADGRILLYNAAAQALLASGGDGEYVGLGRSVFGVIERDLILHALAWLADLEARGEHRGAARMATEVAGRFVRAGVTPVRDRGGAEAGFVLVLDDVTREAELTDRRASVLQELVDVTQRAVAGIRAAVEAVQDFGDVDPEQRARLLGVVRDEAARLSGAVEHAREQAAELVTARWGLEDMRGRDLLTLVRRAATRPGLQDVRVHDDEPDVWLHVDGYAVSRAVAAVAERLTEELGARGLSLALGTSGRHVTLDIRWPGPPLDADALRACEDQPLVAGGRPLPFTLRQVLDRHGGEAWSQRDPETGDAVLRVLLPTAAEAPTVVPGGTAPAKPDGGERPAFYDFDLFGRGGLQPGLGDQPLTSLSYTVFDTETTGLDPARDEIVSIGAVRIVNGRILGQEAFEELVDPARPVPVESTRIHGISTAMVEGRPPLREVLPRFARFVEDTVLVGHNVAFDMRFLAEKENATGVRFRQPVLDTLLLGPVAHPDEDDHSLEALATRLGVNVLGRHTALGDALVTAEVFVGLLRLLEARGVTTMREALDASRRTYHAKVSDVLYGGVDVRSCANPRDDRGGTEISC